jgi:hypothetical protein
VIHLAEERDKWRVREHASEYSDTIQCGEFLEQVSNR